MIIDPDFLDHWKTRLFVEAMGEEHASNYILRLWFHCQQRRTATFEGMTPHILKSICKYSGDAMKLWNAITHPEFGFAVGYPKGNPNTDLGYPNDNPTGLSVPKWAEANSKLLSNWDNGQKGGRPKKPPKTTVKTPPENPTETQTEPNANPSVTGRKEGRKEGKEGINAQGDLEKVAAEMATEFQFRIPGRSKPMLDELRANFHAKLVWLQSQGRNETELIWQKIRDPSRDQTLVMTINQMFKFWQYCGLEGDQRDAAGTGSRAAHTAAARRTVPGGDGSGNDAKRYNGDRVKIWRRDPAAAGNGEPAVPPSQPAAASS